MLTDAAIRKIGLRDKPFKVSDMHGLYPIAFWTISQANMMN